MLAKKIEEITLELLKPFYGGNERRRNGDSIPRSAKKFGGDSHAEAPHLGRNRCGGDSHAEAEFL